MVQYLTVLTESTDCSVGLRTVLVSPACPAHHLDWRTVLLPLCSVLDWDSEHLHLTVRITGAAPQGRLVGGGGGQRGPVGWRGTFVEIIGHGRPDGGEGQRPGARPGCSTKLQSGAQVRGYDLHRRFVPL